MNAGQKALCYFLASLLVATIYAFRYTYLLGAYRHQVISRYDLTLKMRLVGLCGGGSIALLVLSLISAASSVHYWAAACPVIWLILGMILHPLCDAYWAGYWRKRKDE